jgi:hypothetical protein
VRVLDRLIDRLLGDFVEHDALDGHLRLEHLEQVPADRLAFAVGVGREHDFGRALQRRLQRLHPLPLVVRDDVVRLEIAVGVDAQAAPLLLANLVRHLTGRLGQIAYVAVARLDLILVAEKALEGPRLRGRFHNHEGFGHSCRSP